MSHLIKTDMPNNYVNTLTEASDALGVSINVVKEKIASVSFAPDGKQWYKDWRDANHPPNEVQAIALLYRAALAADGDITAEHFRHPIPTEEASPELAAIQGIAKKLNVLVTPDGEKALLNIVQSVQNAVRNKDAYIAGAMESMGIASPLDVSYTILKSLSIEGADSADAPKVSKAFAKYAPALATGLGVATDLQKQTDAIDAVAGEDINRTLLELFGMVREEYGLPDFPPYIILGYEKSYCAYCKKIAPVVREVVSRAIRDGAPVYLHSETVDTSPREQAFLAIFKPTTYPGFAFVKRSPDAAYTVHYLNTLDSTATADDFTDLGHRLAGESAQEYAKANRDVWWMEDDETMDAIEAAVEDIKTMVEERTVPDDEENVPIVSKTRIDTGEDMVWDDDPDETDDPIGAMFAKKWMEKQRESKEYKQRKQALREMNEAIAAENAEEAAYQFRKANLTNEEMRRLTKLFDTTTKTGKQLRQTIIDHYTNARREVYEQVESERKRLEKEFKTMTTKARQQAHERDDVQKLIAGAMMTRNTGALTMLSKVMTSSKLANILGGVTIASDAFEKSLVQNILSKEMTAIWGNAVGGVADAVKGHVSHGNMEKFMTALSQTTAGIKSNADGTPIRTLVAQAAAKSGVAIDGAVVDTISDHLKTAAEQSGCFAEQAGETLAEYAQETHKLVESSKNAIESTASAAKAAGSTSDVIVDKCAGVMDQGKQWWNGVTMENAITLWAVHSAVGAIVDTSVNAMYTKYWTCDSSLQGEGLKGDELKECREVTRSMQSPYFTRNWFFKQLVVGGASAAIMAWAPMLTNVMVMYGTSYRIGNSVAALLDWTIFAGVNSLCRSAGYGKMCEANTKLWSKRIGVWIGRYAFVYGCMHTLAVWTGWSVFSSVATVMVSAPGVSWIIGVGTWVASSAAGLGSMVPGVGTFYVFILGTFQTIGTALGIAASAMTAFATTSLTFISGLSLGGIALVAVGSAAVAYTGYKLYEWATSPAQKRYVRRRQLLLMAGGSIVYMNGWRETTVHAYDNPAITSLGYVNADGRVMLTLPPGTRFFTKSNRPAAGMERDYCVHDTPFLGGGGLLRLETWEGPPAIRRNMARLKAWVTQHTPVDKRSASRYEFEQRLLQSLGMSIPVRVESLTPFQLGFVDAAISHREADPSPTTSHAVRGLVASVSPYLYHHPVDWIA